MEINQNNLISPEAIEDIYNNFRNENVYDIAYNDLHDIINNNINQNINLEDFLSMNIPINNIPRIEIPEIFDISENIINDNTSDSNTNDEITGDDTTEETTLPRCSICMENNTAVVFNCGHMCSCISCSNRVTSCPICRIEITRRQKVYFS